MTKTRRSIAWVLWCGVLIVLMGAGLFRLTARAASQTALITGEIERITLSNPNDVWSGGTIVAGGQNIIIPRNLLIDLPANRLTLAQVFVAAPPSCVAAGESGLAIAEASGLEGRRFTRASTR